VSDRENVLQHVNGLFYTDIGLCGCGNAEEAFDLVRDLLNLAPFYEHRQEVAALVGTGATGHIVLSALDNADLLEHGGTIHGSWLTDKGEWYQKALASITDWDEIAVGVPHDGGSCTDACWGQPIPAGAAT
jgi:hypothetical protein